MSTSSGILKEGTAWGIIVILACFWIIAIITIILRVLIEDRPIHSGNFRETCETVVNGTMVGARKHDARFDGVQFPRSEYSDECVAGGVVVSSEVTRKMDEIASLCGPGGVIPSCIKDVDIASKYGFGSGASK